MDPGLTDSLGAGTLEFDSQREAGKNIFEFARRLRFSFAPTPWRNREWLYLFSHLHVGGIDHHGQPVSALVSRLLIDRLIENILKQNSFQVTTLVGNAAQHSPVRGGVRQDKHGALQVSVSIGALHLDKGKTNTPGPLMNRL